LRPESPGFGWGFFFVATRGSSRSFRALQAVFFVYIALIKPQHGKVEMSHERIIITALNRQADRPLDLGG